MKQRLLATLGIVVSWFVLDYLFHNVILMGDYSATASLWRPMGEMNCWVMYSVTVIKALVFVLIFCQMVSPKTLEKGIKLGVLVGVLVGVGMAGSYAYMPITCKIALVWLVSEIVKFTAAGAIAGFIVKKEMTSS